MNNRKLKLTLRKQFYKFTKYNIGNFITNVKLCNFPNYLCVLTQQIM